MMTTQQVANRFHALARAGNWEGAQNELFSENAVSIEPAHSPGLQTAEGLAAIKQKGETFRQMVEEVHGGTALSR
jgi:hypothetical protein